MSPDEPLALEPSRGLSPLTRSIAIGAGAFFAGVAGTAGVLWLNAGAAPAPAPPAVVTAQPQAAPAPALPPATDVATLSAREAMLAGRLDLLETRLRDADGSARAASSYASQAERLMIAFAARRAIERGEALGPLGPQLRRRFGEAHGEAVSTIAQAATQRVLLEDLRVSLEAIGPRLMATPDASLWSRLRGLFGDLVVLRRVGTDDPRPAARLQAVREKLAKGNVEAALAEVARMPGAANAESWVTAAKQYIAARNALAEIELAAMETNAAPAAAPK
ncbi:MAG: hypothetical protein V4574_11955 [Pseudomonadota bacterium]